MSSQLELANLALGRLIREPILTLEGNDPRAVWMRTYMTPAIEQTIEEYDWPQCRVETRLVKASLPDEDMRDWTYAYVVPSDKVFIWGMRNAARKPIEVFEIGMSSDITSDTNYIFSNSDSLIIRYGSRRASLERFSPQTVDLMATKLAELACLPATKNVKLWAELGRKFKTDSSAIKTRMANMEPEIIDPEFIPDAIAVR